MGGIFFNVKPGAKGPPTCLDCTLPSLEVESKVAALQQNICRVRVSLWREGAARSMKMVNNLHYVKIWKRRVLVCPKYLGRLNEVLGLETANLFGIWAENGKWKMIAGAILNSRGVVLRKKVDREEEGQVLNLGEFDARFTLLQIWNM